MSQELAPPVAQGARDTTPMEKLGVEAPTHLSRTRASLVRLFKQIGFGLALVALWQLTLELELVSRVVLPTPWATLEALLRGLGNLLTGGYVFEALVVTGTEVVAGLILASVAGIGLGILAGDTEFGREVLMPYVVLVNSMPKIAFAPVFVAWLGFGLAPKILLAAFIAFFPVTVNTAAGIAAYSENESYLFASMGATRRQTLLRLKVPTSLPFVFAGLKTAAVFCVVGAIVAEFLGGNGQGIGELIRLRSSRLRMDEVFALIAILSAVGMALYYLISLAERRFAHWSR